MSNSSIDELAAELRRLRAADIQADAEIGSARLAYRMAEARASAAKRVFEDVRRRFIEEVLKA